MKKIILMMGILLGFREAFAMDEWEMPRSSIKRLVVALVQGGLTGIHSDTRSRIITRGLLGAGLSCVAMGAYDVLMVPVGLGLVLLARIVTTRANGREFALLDDPNNVCIPESSRPYFGLASSSRAEYLCVAGMNEELEIYLSDNPDKIEQPPGTSSLLRQLVAIPANRSRALEILLRHGADPNKNDERALLYHSLPHHYSLRHYNHNNYTRLLLQYGADPLKKSVITAQLHGDVFELLNTIDGPNNPLVRAQKKMICDGRDAYFLCARNQRLPDKIRKYSRNFLFPIFNNKFIDDEKRKDKPVEVPEGVCLEIARQCADSETKALHAQIATWEAYKRDYLADLDDE